MLTVRFIPSPWGESGERDIVSEGFSDRLWLTPRCAISTALREIAFQCGVSGNSLRGS
ncbi:hypothetical protein ACOWPH_29890 (plasmid) [Anabaena sp. PCC 7938]|uniref:hypothetical protein n=1 Tax=Anabaena sp. PCC 7938 TaxID=1296340 RepID=UPI000300E3A7|nr:hypothetical protein [Anabaena sp. CCAP 1446/1C]MBY5280492.1 hypothetical protein [Anabaena sp. CCAP 1446/1C]MCM2405490.1 hypothetical protein [Anabaena sp. CCAP 1446/1C]